MFILYLVIFFYIIIFNVLLPLIIDKVTTQSQILNSTLGKEMTKITCSNDHWFYIDPKVTGLQLKYFVDDEDNIISCKTDFTNIKKTRTCGEHGEYNNRYNPCFYVLSELLFYRSIGS